MHRTRIVVAGLCILAMCSCSSGVRHTYRPIQPVGTALPVEVAVTHKAGEPVNGTVYHRFSSAGSFLPTSMSLRAGQLWTLLPTEHLEPDDRVEYYIDIARGEKMYALGSPAQPYVVTFLDQTQMILANLSSQAYATDAANPVWIVLRANGQPIGQPQAVYQMPSVPGEVRASMEPDGRGNYQIDLPPRSVTAGTWRYAIEVPINGTIYRLPEHGYHSFTVAPPVRRVVSEILPH